MKNTLQLRKVALASHGLEFLVEAVQRLARDTDEKDARFAVVHIAVGIELMLKARLVQEHWSLVFDKGKTPSRKHFSSGDFKSITPEQCIEYLAEAAGVTLGASASKALLELAHARNRIVHFAAPPEDLRIIAFRALSETADFIATELELSPEDEGTLAMINAELRKLKEYVDKRLIVIGPKLRELGDDVYWCPRCTHRTLQSPHPVACLLCLEDFGAIQEVYDYQIERVAGQSAEQNKDWGDCPRCRAPFAVRTDRARSTLRCMSCKIEFEPSDMITCPTCDEWFSATNDHCPYCAPQAGTP